MFVTVKQLTYMIDEEIQFLNDGIKSGKANEEYITTMLRKINAKNKRLNEISCNKNLLKKYNDKICYLENNILDGGQVKPYRS